jgi:AcrR family transcriptional regulator
MARDGQETKERIERTALELFVEHGIAETSIRDIAKAAGVSLGALYVHYKGKDELAWELFSRNFAAIGTEMRRVAEEASTLEAKLTAMIGYMFRCFDEDWVAISFVFFARHQHIKRLTRAIPNPYVVFRGVVADAVEAGRLPRQDPEFAAALAVGAIIQVIDIRILGRLKGPLAVHAAPVTQACLRLLRA